MRKLRVSKRFGEVYGKSSPTGSLSIFCPSCPQPGINLPPNWTDLPSWVTRRTITVDGNFHADHIKMRRQDLDVALSNGDGYMVEEAHFKEYLSVAKEPRYVGLLKFNSFTLFYLSCRDPPVEIIEQSMPPTLTIDAIWMLPEL